MAFSAFLISIVNAKEKLCHIIRLKICCYFFYFIFIADEIRYPLLLNLFIERGNFLNLYFQFYANFLI